MTLKSDSIERKQLDLCRGNIIFCHADSFCLQEEKEDEKRNPILENSCNVGLFSK